eukprot:2138103-Amphidinium_carterae.1
MGLTVRLCEKRAEQDTFSEFMAQGHGSEAQSGSCGTKPLKAVFYLQSEGHALPEVYWQF